VGALRRGGGAMAAGRSRRRVPWLRGGVLAACALGAAALPLSKPITRDADVVKPGNKFLRRTATRDNRAPGRHACTRELARAFAPARRQR
jgi:hypothetical protein